MYIIHTVNAHPATKNIQATKPNANPFSALPVLVIMFSSHGQSDVNFFYYHCDKGAGAQNIGHLLSRSEWIL